LWGSEARLVEQVKKFFTRRSYLVRLAVAETVGAAWAAAHFEKISNDEFRMTNGKATHSIFVIRHSSFSLPVQGLRLADDAAALLGELGIETVGQLMALPREGLASRFGNELLLRLDQLTGAGREVIEPRRAMAPLEASYVLEEPTVDRDVLIYVLKQRVDQLARQLAARDQGAVLLECLLHLAGGKSAPDPAGGYRFELQGVPMQVLRVGLLEPSASARQLLQLVELHLETVKLAGEVDRVELRAAVVGRLGERQAHLFADRWSTDPHQFAVLVNRLSSRLGHKRVLRAEPCASPVPERAVAWVPAVEQKEWESGRVGEGESSRKRFSPYLPLSPSPRLPRPLTLYPTPDTTEVVCVAPDGPPQFVWFKGRREPILQCVGPERIETLWWRGPSVRRDYYRVATKSGSHLWMFRRLVDGRWFVHGEFS
jgi:protein ImuB